MVSLFFNFLAVSHSMWDLTGPTRDRTAPLAVEVWSPNHWTARKVPKWSHFKLLLLCHSPRHTACELDRTWTSSEWQMVEL